MTGPCCGGEASNRLVRRLSKGGASILPGLLLVFLPKCPFCLAVWLTAVTGAGFSAAGAAWVSRTLILVWAATVAVIVVPVLRHRAFSRTARPPD